MTIKFSRQKMAVSLEASDCMCPRFASLLSI